MIGSVGSTGPHPSPLAPPRRERTTADATTTADRPAAPQEPAPPGRAVADVARGHNPHADAVDGHEAALATHQLALQARTTAPADSPENGDVRSEPRGRRISALAHQLGDGGKAGHADALAALQKAVHEKAAADTPVDGAVDPVSDPAVTDPVTDPADESSAVDAPAAGDQSGGTGLDETVVDLTGATPVTAPAAYPTGDLVEELLVPADDGTATQD